MNDPFSAEISKEAGKQSYCLAIFLSQNTHACVYFDIP